MATHHIWDAQGMAQPLAKALKKTSNSTLAPLATRPEILVKYYHPEILESRGKALQAKIEAMRHSPLRVHPNLSWPLISVFDDRQQWVGYAMQHMQGVPLSQLIDAQPQTYSPSDRVALVSYLLHLIELLQHMHRHGVFVSHLNPNNILCQTETKNLVLVGCDGFQVNASGRLHPSEVAETTDPIPKHLFLPHETSPHTEVRVRFSVAVLLFQSLMQDHPYANQGVADPILALRQGQFSCNTEHWNLLPVKLQQLFKLCFSRGVKEVACRPNLDQWHGQLRQYQQQSIHSQGFMQPIPNTPKPSPTNSKGFAGLSTSTAYKTQENSIHTAHPKPETINHGYSTASLLDALSQYGLPLPEEYRRKIIQRVTHLIDYEPMIGVLGKTGAGKSSLCNAVFGRDVCDISNVGACTRSAQEVSLSIGSKGIKLLDVPGVGESNNRDQEYAQLYRQWLPKLDLILWVIKADDRAFSSDERCYKELLQPYLAQGLPFFIVLNQVDKLEPFRDWDEVNHQPGPRQSITIEEKRRSVASFFSLPLDQVVPVSANEHYGLVNLVDKIIHALPAHKQAQVLREVKRENRSEAAKSEAAGGVVETLGKVLVEVLPAILTGPVGEALIKAGQKLIGWIKSWF